MVTRPSRAYSAKTFAILLFGFTIAAPLEGAARPECELLTVSTASARWAPPLDRTIKLNAGALTLKDAIDRITIETGLRFSYSGSHVPLEKIVCLSYREAPIGDILAHLLDGVKVVPVLASLDHIVLTPQATETAAAENAVLPVFPIAPLFATANSYVRGREPRPTYAVDVIDGTQLQHSASVEDALRSVPGIWTWESPVGFTAQYGMRGATSFGASSPKLYIDGIEVANPLLATQLRPENIERIEVIRGPQGGALYGSDAINGVTNIITRHRTVINGEPRLHVRSGFAVSTSEFIDEPGLGQDHLVSLQLGSPTSSGAVNLGIGRVGEYMPGSYARHVNLDGNMRVIQDRTLITGTARFFSKSAGNPGGFLRDASFNGMKLSMQQYTLGAKVLFRQNERLTHAAVLGVDGYALDGLNDGSPESNTVADSVLRAAGNGAVRTTLRLSSAARFGQKSRTSALVTVAAEHSHLQQRAEARASNGVSAQVDASFLEGALVSAGVRMQRDEMNGMVATTALPMLGSSYSVGNGDVNLRVRSAYGRAIRWPSMPAGADIMSGRVRVAGPMLSPEEQTGLEAGIDLLLGGRAGIQLTRYDQTATGLVQSVAETDALLTRYTLQSVGEIGNSGWEMQVFAQHGALSVSGSVGLVSSTVLRVADGYAGDLAPGDRMLAVPARTVSVQAAWRKDAWSTSLAATRAADWINYDRRALADRKTDVTGTDLRSYWRRYDGATHLRATIARTLNDRLTLMLSGDNLLNRQTGEPDNMTVIPGRTISFGVRAAF